MAYSTEQSHVLLIYSEITFIFLQEIKPNISPFKIHAHCTGFEGQIFRREYIHKKLMRWQVASFTLRSLILRTCAGAQRARRVTALQQLFLEENSLLFVFCSTSGLCTVVGTHPWWGHTCDGDTPVVGHTSNGTNQRWDTPVMGHPSDGDSPVMGQTSDGTPQ